MERNPLLGEGEEIYTRVNPDRLFQNGQPIKLDTYLELVRAREGYQAVRTYESAVPGEQGLLPCTTVVGKHIE